jgi:hypothetical protein
MLVALVPFPRRCLRVVPRQPSVVVVVGGGGGSSDSRWRHLVTGDLSESVAYRRYGVVRCRGRPSSFVCDNSLCRSTDRRANVAVANISLLRSPRRRRRVRRSPSHADRRRCGSWKPERTDGWRCAPCLPAPMPRRAGGRLRVRRLTVGGCRDRSIGKIVTRRLIDDRRRTKLGSCSGARGRHVA